MSTFRFADATLRYDYVAENKFRRALEQALAFATGQTSGGALAPVRSVSNAIVGDLSFTTTATGLFDGSMTRFGGGAAPAVASDVWSYDGAAAKWRPRFLQTSFNAGVVANAILADGSFVTLANTNPALVGTPAAPVNAPVVTPIYKGTIVDVSADVLPASTVYVVDYSTNGGAYTTSAFVGTGTRFVHSGLDPAKTYAYKTKLRGAADSAYGPASAAVSPSTTAEVNAYGIILASQIATVYLSAIVANLGQITAGQITNVAKTTIIQLDATFAVPGTVLAGIFFASANPVPGTVTGPYIDFTATGTNHFLHHTRLDLNADGSAHFDGQVFATSDGVAGHPSYAFGAANSTGFERYAAGTFTTTIGALDLGETVTVQIGGANKWFIGALHSAVYGASQATTAQIELNGKAYARLGASTTLGRVVGVVGTLTAFSSNVAADTSLGTITLPAGALAAGGILRIRAKGGWTGAIAGQVFRIKFGATFLGTVTTTSVATASDFELDAEVVFVTATTQRSNCTILLDTDLGLTGTLSLQRSAPAETLANAITIDFRGTANTDTLQLDSASVELIAP